MSIPFAKDMRRQRGSILLLTLLFMVIISLFAVAFWNIIPVELHSARRYKDDTRAYFAADAGVVDTLGWLAKATTDGNVDQHFADDGDIDENGDLAVTREGDLEGWHWTATITPGPGTYGYRDTGSPNPIRVYKIDSVASRGNQNYRSVTTWVSQDSFGGKNWTVNAGAANNTLWLNMSTFRLGGDYHTNDKCRINIPSTNFWSNASAAIGGDVTFADPHLANSVDQVEYANFTAPYLPYNPATGASVPGRYEKITAAGRLGVQLKGQLDLPANTDSVAFGTWGDTPPTSALPNTGSMFGATGTGAARSVNVRLNGATPGAEARNGLYIEGNVDQIDLELVNNNQRIRIDQGNFEVEVNFITANAFTIPSGARVNGTIQTTASTYQPTANDNRGWTIIRNTGVTPAEYMVYKEQTNGAIYATGNINGVRGVTKGRRTIATLTGEGSSSANDREIRITGPLTYAGTAVGSAPASANDQLGLISYAVRLEDGQATAAPTAANNQDGLMWPPRNTTSQANPLNLYCSIFAGRSGDPRASLTAGLTTGGGFGSESYDNTGLGAGYMRLFGSITEGVRQAKGTFNSTSGAGQSGYSYSFFEDPNLTTIQPPFFPTLPQYKVISWEEKSVFAY